MVDLNDYNEELTCLYKDEAYLVRDNGAIKRLPKSGHKQRRLDGYWTFGKKDEKNGYMFLGTIRVHQVVATAFHGAPKEKNMVVDHIDTNRCNNRPENLRWVTKLENALNNPITRKKIIGICGSVEAFLNNPSLLKENSEEPNFKWMRTVSISEAINCKANLERWASEDTIFEKKEKSKGFSESIFFPLSSTTSATKKYPLEEIKGDDVKGHTNDYEQSQDYMKKMYQEALMKRPRYTKSLTPSALQENWKTPTEFPKCPKDVTNLEDYLQSLKIGDTFCSNKFGKTIVSDMALSKNGKEIYVCGYNQDSLKKWSLVRIYINEGHYIHLSENTFFEENGVKKAFSLIQGEVWTGEDSIDDYC